MFRNILFLVFGERAKEREKKIEFIPVTMRSPTGISNFFTGPMTPIALFAVEEFSE